MTSTTKLAATLPTIDNLLRVADENPKQAKPYVPLVWDEFLGVEGACSLRPLVGYRGNEPFPESASRAALESLAIIRDDEYLSLLTRFFIRKVTIFCLPGSTIAIARIDGLERLYFCKNNTSVWKPTVVSAFTPLLMRKLTSNPQLQEQFDFAVWPRMPLDIITDVWLAYVMEDPRYLKNADKFVGRPEVKSLTGMINELFKQLRDASDLLA